jgi:hypothetical protein
MRSGVCGRLRATDTRARTGIVHTPSMTVPLCLADLHILYSSFELKNTIPKHDTFFSQYRSSVRACCNKSDDAEFDMFSGSLGS